MEGSDLRSRDRAAFRVLHFVHIYILFVAFFFWWLGGGCYGDSLGISVFTLAADASVGLFT